MHQLLYGACIVLTGLAAGLFYSYQCSVINGLGALADREYLAAFKSINKAILNPIFFLSFLGSIVVLLMTIYCSYKAEAGHTLYYLIVAAIVYAVGVFGVTAVFNVPLNELLAVFDPVAATDKQIEEMRLLFESKWNRWQLVRTIAAISSFIILCIPLIKRL